MSSATLLPVGFAGVLSSLEVDTFLGAGTGGDLALIGGEEVPEIPESLPAVATEVPEAEAEAPSSAFTSLDNFVKIPWKNCVIVKIQIPTNM